MNLKDLLKKFWQFLKKDTWQSWITSLILLIIIIRFLVFPGLSFITGGPLPLVIVESCSMYHNSDFESWWIKEGAWYENKNITKEEFSKYPLKNGLNKGDILIVLGRTEINKGDIIIFEAGSKYPLIHRVVSQNPTGTKGDNNPDQLKANNNIKDLDETSIENSLILGEAKVKVVPLLGWIKLIFFEPLKEKRDRGLCK